MSAAVDVNFVRTIADRRGDVYGLISWDVTHNPVSGLIPPSADCHGPRLGVLQEWSPSHVTHNPVSAHILVSDWQHYCIRVFCDNPPYKYICKYGWHVEDKEDYMWPNAMTCDSKGRVIVAAKGNHYCMNSLKVLSATGQYLREVGLGSCSPDWVCADGKDNMYATGDDDDDDDIEYGDDEIHVFNVQGEPLPTIRRRGRGEFTVSGENLYEVDRSNNHHHLHIHSLTDPSDVKLVPLPEQIPNYSNTHITACRDGRLLITAWGWRAGVGADDIDEDHSYMHVLDDAGHNLTPRPYRYEGGVRTTTLLYDNTLVVLDTEDRLQLVTLPRLNPPLRPLHQVKVASLKNLCINKMRSKIKTADAMHTLAPEIGAHLVAELCQLYI